VTVAVNCWVPAGARLTADGLIVTETAAAACSGARRKIAARKKQNSSIERRGFAVRVVAGRVVTLETGFIRASHRVVGGEMA
jgi:hypothetical protein